MRLILALILAAGMASAQTTVNITNSLIGPVTQNFSNTQVNVSQAVITGAVVNASVTNSFAPVNNITNEVTVGGTTVNNTNTFVTYITNQIDVAGVVITNITQFLTEVYTTGVASVNSATGAVTLTVSNTTNSAGVASWSGTVLSIGTNVPAASGGGISHWAATTGTTTQAGSFFYPTSQVPVFSASSVGFFVATNKGVSLTRPDGTTAGGPAVGINAISLIPNHQFSSTYGATTDDAIAIGTYARANGANGVAVASGATASGQDSAAYGRSATASGRGSISIGWGSVASGQSSLAIGGALNFGENPLANSQNSSAIGFRANATNFGSMVLADGVNVAKGSQGGSNTVTFSFDRGAYFTQTNTVYAAITPTNFVHSGNAGITVTQRFLDATSTIRTNVFVGGILVRGYTE